MPNVSDTILTLVDTATETYISESFTNIWGSLSSSIRLFLVLFVVLYGFAIMRGSLRVSLGDSLMKVILVMAVLGAVSSYDIYYQFVVSWVTQTPDALAGVMSAGESASASSAIGNIYNEVILVVGKIMSQHGWVMPYLLGFIVFVCATIMLVMALAMIMISKIIMTILLGIGPVFLVLLLFKQTARMFETWLQQIINYMMLYILTVAMLGFMSSILEAALTVIPDNDIDLGDTIYICVTCLLTFVALLNVPSVSSSLAGGLGISTHNAGIMATRTMKDLGRRASPAVRKMGSAGIGTTRAAINKPVITKR